MGSGLFELGFMKFSIKSALHFSVQLNLGNFHEISFHYMDVLTLEQGLSYVSFMKEAVGLTAVCGKKLNFCTNRGLCVLNKRLINQQFMRGYENEYVLEAFRCMLAKYY